jgi:hypothetical protein
LSSSPSFFFLEELTRERPGTADENFASQPILLNSVHSTR